MGKTRVGVLLRESMGGNKSSNKSADLQALTQKYHDFCKKIRMLIVTLKKHHECMKAIEQSREAVAKQFAGFVKETPMYESVGIMPSADRPSNTVCSYASIHDELGAKAKSYVGKYQQFVIEYSVEWEKVIRTRIDAGIKKAEELRIDLDHYQKKVEALRLSANQAMAKGKPVSSATQEKLTRNEEKLIASKQNYNRVATDLCILMEEVTERNWRDLHPLLIKCAQFDMTLANDEAKILAKLSQVVDALKQVATEKGISPQPRLKDLAGLKPELLSTRPGGVAGLAIEAGPVTLTPLGSPSSADSLSPSMALPPGSVGPQGMGGFPVQISESKSSDQFGRSNSITSFHSEPAGPLYNFDTTASSSMNMLTISGSPAPPPTLDDVYGSGSSNYNLSSTRSAPGTGNLPPLPPSTTPTSAWNVRSSSFNDADSAYSGFSAPPPMAPPPPPNMPPPPPPQQQQLGYPSYSAGSAPPSYNYNSAAPAPSPWASQLSPPPQQQNAMNPMSFYPPPTSASPHNNSNPNYNPFG